MPESVSPDALEHVSTTLNVLLTTALALLSFSVALVEKFLGRDAFRNRWLRSAWGLLLVSVLALVLCMSQVVTVAATMGEEDGRVDDPAFTPEEHRQATLDSWRALAVYAGATYLLWYAGVGVLIVVILKELSRSPLKANGSAKAALDQSAGPVADSNQTD